MTDSKKNGQTEKTENTAKRHVPKVGEPESLLDEYVPVKKKAAPAAPSPAAKPAAHAEEELVTASTKPPLPTKEKTEEKAEAPSTAKKSTPKSEGKSDTKKIVNRDSKKAIEPENETRATTAKGRSAKRDVPDKKIDDAKKQNAKRDTADSENRPRSSKPAHRVIPYVLILFAIFIGVALILNLICNQGNRLKDSPSEHLMGIVGYHLCGFLFGSFGPAVFVLPLLLLNLAFFWKRYIDSRVTISKIVASLVFLVVLGAVIHVFCLSVLPSDKRYFETAVLYSLGAKMTSGGVIGGSLGYLSYLYLNVAGSIIVGFTLLAVSLFYFLGMTPQHVWEILRSRCASRAERRTMSVSEEDAEEARNEAQMQEKIRRVTAKRDPDESHDETDGAVSEVNPTPKKNPEDRLAPMPIPRLDPNDGSRPFVPRDIGMKLHEENKATVPAKAPTEAKPVQAPARVPQQTATAPVAPTSAAVRPAPKTVVATEKNRDTAVDPIFPRNGENKGIRRIPREDRNFDLSNYFPENEKQPMPSPRTHAPIPPEVPPAGAKRPAAASPTPPTSAPTEKPTLKASLPNNGRPTLSNTKPTAPLNKPTLNSAKGAKPVFRQADKAKQDFGLSNEEFEKLEAKNAPLPKAPVKGDPKGDPKAAPKDAPKKADPKKPTATVEKPKKYVFPPISYLHPGEPMTEENRAEIQANMEQLAATLGSFRVNVSEINYSCGPTVTRYEVVLAPGVRVRNVTNLADDIALALRSTGGVRIEAPIPGTNAVGIEVPNKTRSTIFLRDMIESNAFKKAESKLAAGLGADIAGDPLIFDIAKMPHLLIAGTTGSGKSVCINCIITSLLYKVRPDEVRLVLIDPKKVEFSIYKNIPHLMAPVVTLPKDAAGALQASVEEMERRFEIFENVGVRDLKGYDKRCESDPDLEKLPRIVIIIDELADLMMTAKNEVETAICRIAQKARAAGMHLIIGTQRPSADVVTGLIKANVPSSIAFAVKSQVDSRVILDHGGAEALTGRGDMLFVPIGAMRDTRVQGAFVDEKEVEKICEFLRATNGTAQYDERFTGKLKELAAQCGNKGKNQDDVPLTENGEKGDDPKYVDAIRVAIEEGRISTSLLQRKLEVGYSRAAKLIDRMQAEGIVSPPDGSKARSILITRDQFIERFFSESGQTE